MKRTHFICLIVGMTLMFAGPAGGMLASVVRMRRALAKAAPMDTAAASKTLAEAIRGTFSLTAVGLCVGAFGLATMLLAAAASLRHLRHTTKGTTTLSGERSTPRGRKA